MSTEETDWEAVAAKSLAFLALAKADLGDKTIAERGEFLMVLGVPRSDAAAMLGTTDDSLRVNIAKRARAAAKKGGKNK